MGKWWTRDVSPEKPRFVYAIQHKPTGRIYVGSSANVDERIQAHMSKLRNGTHKNELMQQDADKYGCEYEFFILDRIESHADYIKEYEWMCKLNTGNSDCGYNYNDPHFRNRQNPIVISDGLPISNKDKNRNNE